MNPAFLTTFLIASNNASAEPPLPSRCSQDPREELLKYEDETKDEKEFLGSAYKESQPEGAGLYHRTLEEEEEDFKDEQRKLLDS